MINNIKYILCLLFFFMAATLVADDSHAKAKYSTETGYQGNSLQEYEEFQKFGGGYDDCFTTGKIFLDSSALENTEIPDAIGKDSSSTSAGSVATKQTIAGVSRAVGYAILGFSPIGLIAAGIDYAVMVDVCSNSYVLSSAEWMSLGIATGSGKPGVTADNSCIANADEKSVTLDPKKLSSGVVYSDSEIPYMFHCDPKYNPKTGQIETDPEKIGRVYGYAGKGSQMCNMWPDTDGRYNKIKGAIGKIVVGYWPKISRGWYEEMEKGDPVCALKKHSYGILEAGVEQYISTIHYYGFYWQNPYTGKIRLCALAPYTMFPVKIGCGTIAPPAETSGVDPFIAAYVSGTRCEYLIRGRDDLNSLGKAAIGGVDQSVNRFLRSDLHMTSTVVGCIKDMLLQIFMKSPSGSTGVAGAKPFFQVVQERMKQIVLAALTLYVTLIGLKIMTAGQPPSRAEAVMYFVKFALVLYFATGDAWYAEESGKVVGLYPSILTISEELSSIFLEAQNVNDPLKMCYLNYRSHNILANNDIITDTIPNGVSTAGYPGFIKTTVWDLIDCKVTNYLSFGSCNYSVGGMMSAWITSGAIFTNFPVAICAFIYTLMIIITVFKFAHVFILSMFTITILVFLSPIFVVFALYEPTKGMFQKWMQMLIGYMLYPALLFAFVAIMFATFDAVFYGDLDITKLGGAQGTGDYKAACTNVDSIFCINVEQVGYNNPCEAAAKRLSDDLLESRKVTGFGKYSKLSDAYTAKIRDALLKLMLFSLLFYLFLSSIIEFMAVLVGVQGFGEAAQGLGTALGPIKMAAKAGGKAALAVASAKTAGLAGKAVKGAQKTKGDVKEWMTGRR